MRAPRPSGSGGAWMGTTGTGTKPRQARWGRDVPLLHSTPLSDRAPPLPILSRQLPSQNGFTLQFYFPPFPPVFALHLLPPPPPLHSLPFFPCCITITPPTTRLTHTNPRTRRRKKEKERIDFVLISLRSR